LKKFLSVMFAVALLCSCASLFAGCGSRVTLNVYNWGEYISDGSEGTLDTNKAFVKYCKEELGIRVKVNYVTYASNEDLYAKLTSDAVSFDVIIPSDYMIARLANEGKLEELNFDNIPNYRYIDEAFKGLYYDPEDKYTVPYTYGRVGVIYDANVVDEADAGEWDLMWNEKYSGKILQFNNSRDAFGTAMYKLGIDVNTTDEAEWSKALEELKKQKPLLKGFVMDEIFNMMETGEAAIGAYYAGDYFTMRDNQADDVDLQFYYPERTNLFVDAMCIPKGAQNKELAEHYINFMLSEEVAVANAEYICYASPNSLVYNSEVYREDMGEDAYNVLYPTDFDFAASYDAYAYKDPSAETKKLINTLWENLKTK